MYVRMKPGDLVRFTCNTSVPFQSETHVGIFISVRKTKWDRSVLFYKFLTPAGVKEVILGDYSGTSWEVIS